jgi:hypothetical protein
MSPIHSGATSSKMWSPFQSIQKLHSRPRRAGHRDRYQVLLPATTQVRGGCNPHTVRAAAGVVNSPILDACDMLLANGGAGGTVICCTGRGFARDGQADESAARAFARTFRKLFTCPRAEATGARRRRAGGDVTARPAALPHAGVQGQAQRLVALIAGAGDAARAIAVTAAHKLPGPCQMPACDVQQAAAVQVSQHTPPKAQQAPVGSSRRVMGGRQRRLL